MSLFVCSSLKVLLGKQSINAHRSASYWLCYYIWVKLDVDIDERMWIVIGAAVQFLLWQYHCIRYDLWRLEEVFHFLILFGLRLVLLVQLESKFPTILFHGPTILNYFTHNLLLLPQQAWSWRSTPTLFVHSLSCRITKKYFHFAFSGKKMNGQIRILL